MRNAVSSKKLKRTESRLLIVDDSQVRYNKIIDLFAEKSHQVHAILLDDLQNFEKQLSTHWDLIIFGRAYDLKLEQALTLLQKSNQPYVPVLLLRGEDYHPDQYSQYLNKGVYDILNLDFLASTYMMFVRALSYSRVLQNEQRLNEELELMQQQAQSLVEESRKAIALIQEGIHAEANEEYLKLFGLASEDEIIGLPVLDVLQPKNIQQFKQSFKKVSQGQFDQTGLEIITSNPNATHKSLKLEYLQTDEGLQLIVDIVESKKGVVMNEKAHPLSQALSSIQRHLKNNPANNNAVVTISLKECPSSVLDSSWAMMQGYFQNIPKYLQEQSNISIYKIDALLYLTLVQAESEAVLESQLMGLKALQKPRLIDVEGQGVSLQLRLGYAQLTKEQYDEDEFKTLLGQAFDTALPEDALTLTASAQAGLSTLTAAISSVSFANDSLVDSLALVKEEPVPVAKEASATSGLSLSSDDIELELDGDFLQEHDAKLAIEPELSLESDIQLASDTASPELVMDDLALMSEPLSLESPTTLSIEPEEPALELALDTSPAEVVAPIELSLVGDVPSAPTMTAPVVEMPIVEPAPAVSAPVAPTPVVEAVATPAPVASVSEPAKVETSNESWSPLLQRLQQDLQHGLVTLRYQQLYDKEDQNTHTYEVSSSFIFDNKWHDLIDLEELNQAPELSWELDRWMVIEASKQLHHFVKQYPNAQIIVNLNQHSLSNPQLPELVAKVSKMIGGRQTYPLVLQFSEKAISENVGLAQHHVQILTQSGVQIAVRDFGNLLLSNTILERVTVSHIGLARSFTKMINKEAEAQELQEKIQGFMEIRPVSVSLHGLDDMGSFANAWNVDARYIQGDYFQKRMDHLVDVNDQ